MKQTPLDREQHSAGYWQSPWPVECGGNRRQKARTGRLDAAHGDARKARDSGKAAAAELASIKAQSATALAGVAAATLNSA